MVLAINSSPPEVRTWLIIYYCNYFSVGPSVDASGRGPQRSWAGPAWFWLGGNQGGGGAQGPGRTRFGFRPFRPDFGGIPGWWVRVGGNDPAPYFSFARQNKIMIPLVSLSNQYAPPHDHTFSKTMFFCFTRSGLFFDPT